MPTVIFLCEDGFNLPTGEGGMHVSGCLADDRQRAASADCTGVGRAAQAGPHDVGQQLFELEPTESGFRLQLAEHIVGQVEGGSHKSVFTSNMIVVNTALEVSAAAIQAPSAG